MRKMTLFILSFLMVISSGTIIAFAKDTKNETVTVLLSEFQNYKPDEEKKFDGKKYVLKDFTFQSRYNSVFKITAENLKSKEYTAPPKAVNPDNEEQSGTLMDIQFLEETNSNRKQFVSKTVTYPSVPIDYIIPGTYNTDYYDKETDITLTAELKLSDSVRSKAYWSKADNLNGVITGYDRQRYSLKNSSVFIPKNEEKPIYKGYEKDILKSLNLNPDNYRITDSKWTGSSYYNSDGQLCRSCSYSVEALMCNITAEYRKEIQLPDSVSYTAVSSYLDANSSTVTLNVIYEQAPISNTVIAVSAVIGILIISVLTAAILIFLSKRKQTAADETVYYK